MSKQITTTAKLRTGQVRVFNVHIQSKLLYRTPVTGTGTDRPGQEKTKSGGGSKGGPPALVGTREYEQSDRNWYSKLRNVYLKLALPVLVDFLSGLDLRWHLGQPSGRPGVSVGAFPRRHLSENPQF